MSRRDIALFATTVALCAIACAAGCRKSSSNDAAFVRANLLAAAPADMANKIGARIGDALTYLGSDVDTELAEAGSSFSITHYYRVESPPGDGWALFTHVVGADSEFANADASPMRAAHPARSWKAGEIIRDKQTITLDDGWGSATASVRLGLFRGKERKAIEGGDVDGEGRLIVADVAVKKRERFYSVERARGAITVDGRGDEADWRNAPWSGWFVTAQGGKDPVGRSRARLLWDDDNLYALIEVEDTDVHSPFAGRDDTLWKADVVELFIDADGNRQGYVELQVNPNNAVFDAFFPQTRAQKHHFEWNSSLRSAVTIDGTADERGDRDRGWTAEIAIPHRDVKGMDDGMKVSIPPRAGDRWRLNVVRVDKAKGARSITASSWNPITIRDFHALGRMLTVVFADGASR